MEAGGADPAALKRALRREAQTRLRAMTPDARAHASTTIVKRLLASAIYRDARSVHCYLSLPLEIDTAPLLQRAWSEGKRVYVPYQIPASVRLGLARWEPGMTLVPGPLGVMEPPMECRLDEPIDGIELVIVPGLAFDRKGTRLGRGKGYYDRFLAALTASGSEAPARPAVLLALAFSCQILPELPRDAWDVPVEHVFTEDEAFSTFQR